ncbi:MAG: hypothetical protein ACTSSJ_00745 [Candidatus Odinarchaeia archaeon]
MGEVIKIKKFLIPIAIKKTKIIVKCPLCGEEVRISRTTPDEMGTHNALANLTLDEVIKRCTIQNYSELTKDLHSRPYLYAYLKGKKESEI